jgi:mannose-6-phosphate isomerase class I
LDAAQLLAVARFEAGGPEVLRPVNVADGERNYRTPASEFELALIDISPDTAHVAPVGRGVELLLGLRGSASLVADGHMVPLGQGRSAFVPAAVPAYRIEGEGRVCRARVPDGIGPEGGR